MTNTVTSESAPASAPEPTKKVLVVDDSTTILRVLERNLKKRGYATILADSGNRALNILDKELVDAVLLDFRMPDMDGLETFGYIRTKHPHLPVIMITGEGSTQLAVEFVKAGGAAYIKKPIVDFDDLDCKIHRSIEFLRLREERDMERSGRLAAEETDRLKSAFLANINHEFRTPLTIIMSAAENASQHCTDDVVKEKIGNIIVGASRLLRLVKNVLNMSKIQAGQEEYRLSSCNLGLMVRDICVGMRSLAEKHSISITVDDELPPDSKVTCDVGWISQVIRNLLDNAIKFSDVETTVAIRLRKTKEDMVEFSIANCGVGIPLQDHEMIFHPFTQSSASFSGIEGSGVGLALCKSIITAHGGNIWVESEADEHVVFKFILPKRWSVSGEGDIRS